MKGPISQRQKVLLPFGFCWDMVSSNPSISPTFLELQASRKGFSSATERRPLLWQDYFPFSAEQGVFEITQPLAGTERQVIRESLEVCHHRNRLYGIKRKTTPKKENTKQRVMDALKANIGLEACDNFYEGQVSSEEERTELANILNASGMPDEVKEHLSADDIICILQTCKKRKDLVLAKCVHAHVRANELGTHVAVGNHLVPVLVECGSVADAQEAFDRLPLRNVFSWTSLLIGYIQEGQLLHALNLYEKMQAEGIPPSSYTLVALLKVCTALRDMERGRKMHTQAVQYGFASEVIVGSTVVDMYIKAHSLVEAQKVFDTLLVRNVVAWSVLTAGYADHGEGQAALECLNCMQVEGVVPNAVTYLSILKACSSAGLITKGQNIHAEIVHKGFEGDLFVGNTLIDMYAKGGALLDARGVFDKLPVPDVSSWNVMIQGYSMNHDNHLAVQLFESMRSLGVKPDAITFACILSACSRANLLHKGQEVFNIMREVYGILPSTNHLNCMVDLLARTGQVWEAEKLLDSSPTSSSVDTWRALLSACKKFAEIEIGERCFYQLIQMDPECAAPYVLMGNIYECAGRWEDAFKVEELRKLSAKGALMHNLPAWKCDLSQARSVGM